jgi:hypothetical protein
MAALRLGWKYPTYAAHEAGSRNLTPSVAKKYARAFDVHAEFLLFGSRPPDWYTLKSDTMEELSVPSRYMRMFRGDSATEIKKYKEKPITGLRQYVVADTGNLPQLVYALSVETDEMAPRAPAAGDVPVEIGDILIVDADPEKVKAGSIAVVTVRGDDRVYIRKAKMKSAGKMEFVALNGDHPTIDSKDVILLNAAILHIRNV